MWISLNIIQDMVDIKDIPVTDIANRLTMSTAEIDSIEYSHQLLKNIYTAKLIEVNKHPNADKLTVCKVDTGKGILQVVCGAPNHKAGDIVALAPVGTKFTDTFTVTKTKLRGVESEGMLCSERELGLSDDHSGIMVFPENTPIGVSLATLFPEKIDVRLEIDNKSITHRPDLWSHTGFAREIAALFKRPFKYPVNYDIAKDFKSMETLIVTIKNPEGAPRYCGLVVNNITIKESPDWLKARVEAIGMRPINNIVDITNYVMAELGEPMHAFDRAKLRGNEIIVRFAKDGEHLMTLDGQEHILTSEDIVIADSGGAIALAGVMGGGNSEIEDTTTSIVLEAANFNPVYIRRTANRYNLRTEAAIRFEKSLDPELCPAAIIRCYELIKMLCPQAQAATPIIDTYPVPAKPVRIHTSTEFIRKKLGHTIDDKTIESILSSLDFKITRHNNDLTIDVPSYRATKDISIPDDIVEEIGRIYGYDNIPEQPPLVPCAPPSRNIKRTFERDIKSILVNDFHMTEVSNYSFVGEALLNKLQLNEDKELKLKNPLSKEQDRLRRSLIPNLIVNITTNQRFFDDFRIFELGRVYLKEDRLSNDLATENTRVSGVIYSKKPQYPVFYDAKACCIGIFEKTLRNNYILKPKIDNLPPYAHPARSLELVISNKPVALICELHPKTANEFEIKGNVALFDIDVDLLLSLPKQDIVFKELPKFPDVPFDISILTDEKEYAATLVDMLYKADKEHIADIEVISVYNQPPIPQGKKSVSFRITFRAKDHTLSPEEVDSLQKKVISFVEKSGYKLR
ncbi:MAG: phenylalanine--tRNA ligase subunit beta [Spirochaetes bacterium]|nr:phenylalanine--tRNA ligase subunit beta [Spirochaetota bacterium]